MQHTTIEQSRRLVELGLATDTADLHYDGEGDVVGKGRCLALHKPYKGGQIPSWSLDALLKVIPFPYQITRERDGKVHFILLTVNRRFRYDTEMDAVYTMVAFLLEQGLLDEEKLRNLPTDFHYAE